MFRCTMLSCSLSPEACASRQGLAREYPMCQGCAQGIAEVTAAGIVVVPRLSKASASSTIGARLGSSKGGRARAVNTFLKNRAAQ